MDDLLDEIQTQLLARATALRDANMKKLDTEDDFRAYFADERRAASPHALGRQQRTTRTACPRSSR